MSITAEKISKERIEELRCRAADVKRYAPPGTRPTMAVFANDLLAILSLLQQGEPEGALRKAYNKIEQHMFDYTHETHSYDYSTNAWECSNGEVVAYVEGLDKALEIIKPLLSASPLPPAPGAETGDQTPRLGPNWTSPKKHDPSASSSRQAALEETLLSLCSQIERDLKSAHAEICKLQRIDPKTHTWPEWSPQANTLRWVKKIRSEIIDDASYADLRASGGIFAATTPPAEGETK